MFNKFSKKLKTVDGYAALFSFLVMLVVFTVVVGVFSSLAIKSTSRIRLNLNSLKNMYAADGFAEDVLRRIYDNAVVDASDAETLVVGDSTVSLSFSLEDVEKRHDFSSQTQNKYFRGQTLLVDDTDPSDIKIKEWEDSL